MKPIIAFIIDYCQRHAHPVNAILHIMGVPAAFYGFYLLFCGQLLSACVFIVVGYLLQYLGHQAQGNEVGEVTLIKTPVEKFEKKNEYSRRTPMNNQAPSPERNNQVVVIDGASGYMGSHITAELRQLGYTVRCVVRLKSSEEDVRLLEKTGAEVYRANLGAPESQEVLRQAFEGAGCAIHTIGTVAPRKGETLSDLHIHQTASFVNTCEKNKVGKMIMISSLGVRPGASANYHQTKWLAEEILRKQQIPYLILRPAFVVGRVFGRRNSKLVDRYLNLIKERASVPLIAGGGNLIQPIFISDLVKAVVEGVSRPASDSEVFGRTLDIAGPEQMTMRQFVEKLALEVVGQTRTYKTISPALAGFAAVFCELAQDVPTVSSDQVKLAQENTVCLDNALEAVFQIKPTDLRTALSTYKDQGLVSKQGTPQQVS